MIFDVQLDEYINTILTPGLQLFTQEQIDPLMYGAMGIVLSPGLTYHISIAKVKVLQRNIYRVGGCVNSSRKTIRVSLSLHGCIEYRIISYNISYHRIIRDARSCTVLPTSICTGTYIYSGT